MEARFVLFKGRADSLGSALLNSCEQVSQGRAGYNRSVAQGIKLPPRA